MKFLYLFVEGNDDERFLKSYCHSKYQGVEIRFVQYAKLTGRQISSLINALPNFRHADYFFFADADGATIEAKIDIVKSKYPYCDASKIRIVQREIESWYIAGLRESMCIKHKIKYIPHTDDLSKEKFDSMLPKGYTHISFQVEILKNYDVELAKSRNASFRNFADA